MLNFIEKYNQPSVKAEIVIIILHGLGADANDFTSIVAQLNLNFSAKFVFPNAPKRPISVNNGYVMQGWYDIYDWGGINHKVDQKGILTSVEEILNLIHLQLKDGYTADKIILGGFSQGGVISYYAGLNTKYKLAGILALSCYIPDKELLLKINQKNNKSVPISICHGTEDLVISYTIGFDAYQFLKINNYNVTWSEYNMAHSVCNQQIKDISYWLNNVKSGVLL